ncbi:MAG: hypothetical protein JW963_19445 [Anaerolineales bacterium]|nr:hypothetical protein [Anaerolineales bacterium]
MGKKEGIRDFIYLDIERVRSFVAQLSEGLTSARTLGTEHQTGGEVSGEGSIPLLAKASGAADYHFMRSRSETKSLHDHIFEELLDGLREKGLLTRVPNHDFKWKQSAFSDGMFILVSGIVKIVDYKSGIEALENFPKLMKLLVKIMSQGETTQEQVNEGKKLQSQIRNLPTKDIASFVDQFYSELVRIKVFPYTEKAHVFVGTSDKSLFRYAPAALTGLYGSIVDADWQCLVQVNRGKVHDIGEFAGQTSQVEDAVETIIDQLGMLTNLTQGVQFPSVAVTPIAIFREIAKF